MADKRKAQPGRTRAKSDANGGGNRLFYILAGLIVVAGVVWLVAVRGGGIGSTPALPTPVEFEGLAAAAQADSSVGIPMGPEDAPIEIVEFVDYSCPHCAQFAGFAGKLLRQNYVEPPGAPVRWILYDFVLGGFPNSIPASMVARCAGDQGAYWPVHDLLFSRQSRWAPNPSPAGEFRDIIEAAGLDVRAWSECMSEGRHLEEIAASRKYGEQKGVGSTPTLFLNGQLIDLSGVEPYSYIEGLIKAALAAGGGEATTAESGDGGD